MKHADEPLHAEPLPTIGESAYRRIRSDIIFGRLPPRQKLKLERLRDSYGASISTLREILNRLSSESLVVAEGQRGFEVAWKVHTKNERSFKVRKGGGGQGPRID